METTYESTEPWRSERTGEIRAATGPYLPPSERYHDSTAQFTSNAYGNFPFDRYSDTPTLTDMDYYPAELANASEGNPIPRAFMKGTLENHNRTEKVMAILEEILAVFLVEQIKVRAEQLRLFEERDQLSLNMFILAPNLDLQNQIDSTYFPVEVAGRIKDQIKDMELRDSCGVAYARNYHREQTILRRIQELEEKAQFFQAKLKEFNGILRAYQFEVARLCESCVSGCSSQTQWHVNLGNCLCPEVLDAGEQNHTKNGRSGGESNDSSVSEEASEPDSSEESGESSDCGNSDAPRDPHDSSCSDDSEDTGDPTDSSDSESSSESDGSGTLNNFSDDADETGASGNSFDSDGSTLYESDSSEETSEESSGESSGPANKGRSGKS